MVQPSILAKKLRNLTICHVLMECKAGRNNNYHCDYGREKSSSLLCIPLEGSLPLLP